MDVFHLKGNNKIHVSGLGNLDVKSSGLRVGETWVQISLAELLGASQFTSLRSVKKRGASNSTYYVKLLSGGNAKTLAQDKPSVCVIYC